MAEPRQRRGSLTPAAHHAYHTHATAAFPASVAQAVQYSPNVRAWGCLTQGQLLPFARTAQLINDLHGIAILLATLQDWGDEACVALQMTADTIAHSLRAARWCELTSRVCAYRGTCTVACCRQRQPHLIWRACQARHGGDRRASHSAATAWRTDP